MKKGLIITILLAAVVVIWIIVGALEPKATLEVVRPEVQTIRVYVEEQAITELPHDHLIAMPIAGWLRTIDLREGDAVTRDQVVARLETDDLEDRVHQARQHIAVLESQIAETSDHRLEENALVDAKATVKAIDETVMAAEAKLGASRALLEFNESEVQRLKGLIETSSATDREVREAEMEWRRSRADYEGDKLEVAALKTLAAVSYVGPKFITDYIDRKSFTLAQRQKELVEAKTQLQIEQRNLDRAEIKAPIDGVVLQRHQTRRQFLPAGTPLLTIGRLDDMEVVAEVLTERATRIQPGDPVDVYGQAVRDGTIHGTVLRVYPAGFKKISSLGVEQQRVKVAVAMQDRPKALGVGFRVYVRIYYDQSENALTIPRTALFRDTGGNWNVMLVVDGRTELRPIEVGLLNDDLAEITRGLAPGDAVVLRPSHEITSGTRVDTKYGASHPDLSP